MTEPAARGSAGKRPVVLVVDDDPGDVVLLEETCRELKLDYDLRVCRDGEEAWRYLVHDKPFEQEPQPDLILLDLNLPRRNGRELFAQLRSQASLKDVPVVVLTTSRTDADLLDGSDPAFNLYVSKPMRLEGFIEALRRIHDFFLDSPKG